MYKVCILAAGAGSRLNEKTKYFNKALLRVGNLAVISHQIDYFPRKTEFVIALGYKGDIVRQYLTLAHPDTNFTFVEIDKYNVAGSGPGYALEKCKHELQSPFFFLSCDTLVIDYTDWVLKTGDNWIGCASLHPDQIQSNYCMVKAKDGIAVEAFDKKKCSESLAFIGLAYIRDYKHFWKAIDGDTNLIQGEKQISTSLFQLSNLHIKKFNRWLDTGCEEGLASARKCFSGINNLDKQDEELYVVGGKVVKYFHDAAIAQKRIYRANVLKKVTPHIISSTNNFYKYDFVHGSDLFQHELPSTLMQPLLDYASKNLWSVVTLNEKEAALFDNACRKFYWDKTLARLEKFYKKVGYGDFPTTINGIKHDTARNYLENLDWNELARGIPSNFHGDFVFSNIVCHKTYNTCDFTLIDWRQDFAEFVDYGDRYYDFAKLWTCLSMPHNSIKKGDYKFSRYADDVVCNINIEHEYAKCHLILKEWLLKNGYNVEKVHTLSAIILLNMAPLHEAPLDEWLYFTALQNLESIQNERKSFCIGC